jgi:hypothetical protein
MLNTQQLDIVEGHVESQIELLYCSIADEFELQHGDVTPNHTLKKDELTKGLITLMNEYVSANL